MYAIRSYYATKSKYLAQEYIPEVRIANDLRGAANRAMYAMRGYGYSEEEVFYQNALVEMEAIKKALAEGRDLSERSFQLKKLAQELQVAEGAVAAYSKLVDQTVEINKTLLANRDQMDQAARSYLDNCDIYLSNQNRSRITSYNVCYTKLLRVPSCG